MNIVVKFYVKLENNDLVVFPFEHNCHSLSHLLLLASLSACFTAFFPQQCQLLSHYHRCLHVSSSSSSSSSSSTAFSLCLSVVGTASVHFLHTLLLSAIYSRFSSIFSSLYFRPPLNSLNCLSSPIRVSLPNHSSFFLSKSPDIISAITSLSRLLISEIKPWKPNIK